MIRYFRMILVLTGILITGVCLAQESFRPERSISPRSRGKCGDGICDSLEKEKGICPQDCKVPESTKSTGPSESLIVTQPDSSNSIDADGIFWGTEVYPDLLESTKYVIAGTLKTRYLKIRLCINFAKDGKGFSPILCMPPGAPVCQKEISFDDVAKKFKENSYSMIPMISPGPGYREITAEDINTYVDFVDWFISRYKDDANIKYVELINAPMVDWKGTEQELLELNNKVYDRIKSKYPDILVGTPGFEYMFDKYPDRAIKQIEYFLDKDNAAKFDFWVFHGYPVSQRALGRPLFYPPTKKPINNKYAGITGILEIRKKLNENSWQERKIIDTEHIGAVRVGPEVSDEEDRLEAAYLVQALLLKRTLRLDGKFVLSGIMPLKIISRGQFGEHAWGSLKPDGSLTQTVKAIGFLLSKLNEYKYSSHISGEFDNENQVWIEKFTLQNKGLYIFFKPFKYQEGKTVELDNQTLAYNLNLEKKPSSVSLIDTTGNTKSITPNQKIVLEAVNSPQFLEVEY